ncbi:uncharacterized protein B0J16DRAFT_404119 [Fusarium flagelliforme]|uniref:uncharacterized protein n=1 Tax=Fusarium flagelliforme TaxID=2675880 RepID=UPI001E8EC553|nr:uncharacterized protein B0J16DRAFT_404119 [Fusarium flagelliforme]KAH7174443.1 hypothetical protein B0J16DRAFT_404119 [Fusarium flagelliforme]
MADCHHHFHQHSQQDHGSYVLLVGEEFPQKAREYNYFPSRELNQKKQAKKIQGLVGDDFEDKFAKAESEKKAAAAQEWLALDRPLPRLPASLIHLLVPVRPRVPAALSSHAPIAGYSRQRKRNGSPSPSVKAIAASSRLKNSHLSRKRKKGGLNMPSEKAQRLNNSTRKSQKTQTRLPENIEDTSSVYEDSTFDPTTEEFDQLTSPSHRISGHSGLSDSESETVDLSIIEVSSDDTSNSDMDTHHEGSVTHDIADTDANPDTELDADPDDDLDADTNVHSDASSVQEQDDVFNWQQAFQTMARDCQQTNKMMSEAMANRRKDERFQANMTTFSTTAQAQINDLKKDGKAKDSRMDKFQVPRSTFAVWAMKNELRKS